MATKQTPPEPDLPNIRRHLRARALARLLGWGSAATVALAAVALTSQSEDGRQRLQMAIAYVSAPARAVAQLPPASLQAEANTRHLAAQLSELAADRERLTARIAVLERSLEDMTGSIKQQNERLPAAQAASTPPPTPAPVATTFPSLPPLAMPAIGEAKPGWQMAAKPPETAEAAPPPPTEARRRRRPSNPRRRHHKPLRRRQRTNPARKPPRRYPNRCRCRRCASPPSRANPWSHSSPNTASISAARQA